MRRTGGSRGNGPIEAVLPAVTRHRALIERLALAGDAARAPRPWRSGQHAAFRRARAALAASGTVTLELALAGVPMVVAYKVSRIEEAVARVSSRYRPSSCRI